MNRIVRFHLALSAAFLLFQTQPQAATSDPESIEQRQNVVCALKGMPVALAALQERLPEYQGVTCPPHRASLTSVVRESTSPSPAPTNKNALKAAAFYPVNGDTNNETPNRGSYQVFAPFLRNSWADLGLLGNGCLGAVAGVSADKAQGASASFTRDYANNNKIWLAQAMGGAVYSDCNKMVIQPGGGDSGLFEKSIAAYAQINSDYNSNATFAKKNNADTRTAGLSAEVAYLHSSGDIDVFRVTPNVVFDNIKNTTAAAVMAEYAPVWIYKNLWADIPIFGNTTHIQFDPDFKLQYANAMEASKPLQFSGKDQSLRIGPELAVLIKPLDVAGSFLSHIGLSETFHPWYEAYTGRGSYWWDNSIYYNISDDGNFAVKLSYQRGEDENSGTMTNQYILSLAGKY